MLSKKNLSTKFALFCLLLLLLFLGDLKFRQWQSQRQINQQKQSLEGQANELQQKNDELTQSLQYLSSPSFKERVAREQLNLKKDGEQVYSFSDGPTSQPQSAQDKTSNAKKWWDYFFNE
jgi:cell division protein FtsL